MKKSLKRGFVMAEMIVVSIVVLTALIVIYLQFITVNNGYYRSFNYNSVDDLYALNNVKEFILEDNFENITNALYGKSYIDLTSCSTDYFIEYNYCKTLLDTLNITSLIMAYEDVNNLKNDLKEENTLTEGMYTFVKTIASNKNNKYRLIAEFDDGRYATLKLGSFIVSNISNECVREGNTCSLDAIKSGVSIDVSVSDTETYKFYVLNDDGTKLTLIMDEMFTDNLYWDDVNTNGPTVLIDYMSAKVKNWVNVKDLTYTLGSSVYNGCTEYNACTSNVYTLSSVNSKARLPMVQELSNIGCTNEAGSCPSWLTNGLNINGANGFWTSTASTDDVWYVSYDNRLNITSVDTENVRIKPVIILDKREIE